MRDRVNGVLGKFRDRSEGPMIIGGEGSLTGGQFLAMVEDYADLIRGHGIACLAVHLDNGPDWLAFDLAAMQTEIALVPLPGFFSRDQVAHVLETAGVDAIVSPHREFPGFRHTASLGPELRLLRGKSGDTPLPAGTAKVTFTSGTTGRPKGACLSLQAMERVARAVATATAEVPSRRHLCLLPLSVLLENIAGAWGAVLRGAQLVLPHLAALGWGGSSRLDVGRLLDVLDEYRPDTMILLPQLLNELVWTLERSGRRTPPMSFVAVGGARTAPATIERARALGIPVYEGYGLSECASVVSLNLPSADRLGSVGRVLDGARLRIDGRGAICFRSSGFLGYAGSQDAPDEWLDSGDLGEVDDEGYLHVRGRSKNVLITGYGRNVAPEWVESELLAERGLLQAVVVGDGWPRLAALIVARPGTDIAAAIERCNRRLPDYARIGGWRRIPPLTVADGLVTANGRPRREQILRIHRQLIEELRTERPFPTATARPSGCKPERTTHELL